MALNLDHNVRVPLAVAILFGLIGISQSPEYPPELASELLDLVDETVLAAHD
jgi:hypothetical protein